MYVIFTDHRITNVSGNKILRCKMDKWFAPALSNMDTQFADCRIFIASKVFECHKVILACASDVFKRMMLTNCKESISGDICLEGVTPETFEIFRKYIYSYNINKLQEHDNATLMDLYEFGNQWIVPSITNDCLQLLTDRAKTMKVEELIEMFEFAYNFNNKNLILTVTSHLNRTPHQVLNARVYLLGSDVFKEYITTVAKYQSEISKFRTIAKYLEINGFLQYIKLEDDANNKSNLDNANPSDDHTTIQFELRKSILMDKVPNGTAIKMESKSDCCDEANKNINETQKKEIGLKESEKPKVEFVKSLLESIKYSQMSGSEFYEGPGKSCLFTYQFKFETINQIFKRFNSDYLSRRDGVRQ